MDRDGTNLGEGPCKSLSVLPLTQFVSGTCGIETGTYSIGITASCNAKKLRLKKKTGARDSDAISWAESNRGGAAGYDQ